MIKFCDVFKFYRTRLGKKIILNNVSLSFDTGTNYSILGVNGAGKTTTMKLLAGLELPNSGKIERSVRISWPLGFSNGLHPNLTGRENASFVARLYGEDPKKVVAFIDDFSELKSNLDKPFGTYSSGMAQRFSFGLSMAIEFECYLIDEVIAVGDANFQVRCYDEFEKRRLRSDIILISHSMELVRKYSSRGLVLANGLLHEFSNINEAIELYKKMNR